MPAHNIINLCAFIHVALGNIRWDDADSEGPHKQTHTNE